MFHHSYVPPLIFHSCLINLLLFLLSYWELNRIHLAISSKLYLQLGHDTDAHYHRGCELHTLLSCLRWNGVTQLQEEKSPFSINTVHVTIELDILINENFIILNRDVLSYFFIQ